MIQELTWTKIGPTSNFPEHLGSCVKVNGTQIAIFNIPTEQKWYAVQNFNPQNQRMVLSRGLTGDADGEPIVICPLHKYRYSLISGECLTDSAYKLDTYPIREEEGELLVGTPA
ncbi:nitrite reductase small subunit NirD [Rubritalea spongiae]|uniref:Nitrite reductase small subunit NirD n=1 Tax=Rubritalea spongiae TaxID=430797 RepID=A0ABW5E2Q2_9BACT